MDGEWKSKSEYDPDSRYTGDMDETEELDESNVHPMDTVESEKLLSKLMEWRSQARIAQSENRREMAIDEDYYDGDQWTQEEKEELESRGQSALVFNEIKPAINWIIGTEKRTRVDWKVLPRNKEDSARAEGKTKLLKYIADVNKAAFERSSAFAEATKAGLSWLEDGIRGDESDEPLFSRWESWRNVWFDHLSRSKDMSDARFLIREKWVDIDIAIKMFPDRKLKIESAESTNDLYSEMEEEFFDSTLSSASQNVPSRRSYVDENSAMVENRRSRVKLIEMWYRDPCECSVMRVSVSPMMQPELRSSLENMKNKDFDENDKDMQGALENGYASIYDTIKMKVKCAMFVEGALLQDMDSPYNHNRFPLTPVWCYRRARDNTPYGIIRDQRDPQSDLNKQRSKAQFILSANQILMEKGAVEDKEELREEAAAPDGIIEYKSGKSLEFRKDVRLAEEHIMLQRQDGEYIRAVSGVTSENLGQQTNATSGKAIEARQMQGAVTTAELFDNLRYAMQIQGENQLSMIEQFYTEPKIIRVLGDRGHREYISLNGSIENEQGEMEIENDITSTKADFIIDEQDYRESTRQAMFETMMNMIGQLAQLSPEIALSFLDLVIDMSDIPGKDELVSRIRQITGQIDPADDSGEAEKQQEAKEQQEQQQAQIQELMQELEITRAKLEVQKVEREIDGSRLDNMNKAVEVAEKIAHKPDIATVADSLAEGGEIQ